MSNISALAILLVLAGCAAQSNPPFAVDETVCATAGRPGTSEYRQCIADRVSAYDERSNRWRVEQSN
ncbi:MAG: hypothetical protein ACK4GK_00435 [Ferrovibrio sp.]